MKRYDTIQYNTILIMRIYVSTQKYYYDWKDYYFFFINDIKNNK